MPDGIISNGTTAQPTQEKVVTAADLEATFDLVTDMECDFPALRAGLLAVSCIGEYARLDADCLKEEAELGHALTWISDHLLSELGTLQSKWEAANSASHKLAYPEIIADRSTHPSR
jgi:hypothetical protein